jgi:hypothetical protein
VIGASRVEPFRGLDAIDCVFIRGTARAEAPDGEGERRREGGGASSKLTYSCFELRLRLTICFSPAPALGARGRGGRVFGHPVGEVGVETGSREGPATAGRTGAVRTVADCVDR